MKDRLHINTMACHKERNNHHNHHCTFCMIMQNQLQESNNIIYITLWFFEVFKKEILNQQINV